MKKHGKEFDNGVAWALENYQVLRCGLCDRPFLKDESQKLSNGRCVCVIDCLPGDKSEDEIIE